jgi:hypothetical protein
MKIPNDQLNVPNAKLTAAQALLSDTGQLR